MRALGNYYGVGFTSWGAHASLIEQRQAKQAQQAQVQPQQKNGKKNIWDWMSKVQPEGTPEGAQPPVPVEPEPGPEPTGPTGPETPPPLGPEEPKKASIGLKLGIGGVLLVGGAIATAYILKKRRQRNYL